ncbi:hypothetical protein AVEN_172039-1 [Araneus ventricosus]|uniref:Reverse transcriptase zinc-binding domain-containing protein n=1 Tax=Araneus ventricosus TaxID=182803 RepID=A0A4Y2S7Q7_ARAVE|nr:hypothetical protein AVEN_153504-1 [Araneus ventricosus]GBN84234.1 hypothetical protein AVEN_172039-1 [Araneus ventricosus]
MTTLYPCRRQGFQNLLDKLSLLSGMRRLEMGPNTFEAKHNAMSTKEFFPSIHGRLKVIHFVPNFRIIQFLTEHGNFKAYLKRFNLSRTDLCFCSSGEIQDVNHLILSCPKFTPARCLLISSLKKNNLA